MKQSTYTNEAVENLFERYIERDGEITEVIEGSLGYGTTICTAHGCKSAVIQEVFVNSWSSTHTIRMYNKLPKKYINLLNKYHETN